MCLQGWNEPWTKLLVRKAVADEADGLGEDPLRPECAKATSERRRFGVRKVRVVREADRDLISMDVSDSSLICPLPGYPWNRLRSLMELGGMSL
jgi:hypothetical protein